MAGNIGQGLPFVGRGMPVGGILNPPLGLPPPVHWFPPGVLQGGTHMQIPRGPRPWARPFGNFPNLRFPPPLPRVRAPVSTKRDTLTDTTNIPEGYSGTQRGVQNNGSRPQLYTSPFLPRMGPGPATCPRFQPHVPGAASPRMPAHTMYSSTEKGKEREGRKGVGTCGRVWGHATYPQPLAPPPHVPKPKVKKLLEELHKHSCSPPGALVQLSTSAR